MVCLGSRHNQQKVCHFNFVSQGIQQTLYLCTKCVPFLVDMGEGLQNIFFDLAGSIVAV